MNCVDTVLQKAGYFRIQNSKKYFENGISNQLYLTFSMLELKTKVYTYL